MKKLSHAILFLAFIHNSILAEDWPQAAGPHSNFQTTGAAPTTWSVVNDENIAWKITLPETGQSTPIVVSERVYFTTMEPVETDSKTGANIIAWCCSAKTGDVLWQRKIVGKHPLRLSGCFSDSSAPPAVCDGRHVVFINASGTIACFDLDGHPIWRKAILTAGRTIPFLHDGNIVFIRQIYPPESDGIFPHKYKNSARDMWTRLQAINMASGDVKWTSECGCNMGCAPLKQPWLHDGSVAIVGRGGGHSPPETPEGISMVNLADGSTIWTLKLDRFMSTQTYSIRNGQVHLFHADDHLSVNAVTGKIEKRVSIIDHVSICRHRHGRRTSKKETIPSKAKNRMITQGSNLVVGQWHYFRSYTKPYLGRVNLDTATVEYLELPLQLERIQGSDDKWHWHQPQPEGPKDKSQQIQNQGIANEVKNSRGFVVMGDKRSTGNGWGHIAAPTISVAADHLYVPVMNGTVYVLNWKSDNLDENAIAAINDLGPAGQSWTRSSISFAGRKLFAHTIRELICIAHRE